jgi:DNA-binding NtrC family response regulator
MSANRRKNFTVLVAEDEDALQSLAIHTIKEKGLNVLVASSAEEAIRLWDRHYYDIVLLFTDIVLPGALNGFDIATHIRAKVPSLPVIFSSGHNRAMLADGASIHEDAAYLTKPYRQIELSALISKMLAARSLREAADRVPK